MGLFENFFKSSQEKAEDFFSAPVLGWTEKVRSLVENGADVNTRNQNDETPLIYAAKFGKIEVINILIKEKVDVNAQSKKKNTGLIWAALRNHLEIVKILIKAGAHLDVQNNEGDSALILAAKNNHQEIVKRLIKAGANANIKDDDNKVALNYIDQDKYPEMTALLKDAMAHPEKYKPISEDEKNKIATQVQAMSVQEIRELSKIDPDLLQKLCVLNGVMESIFDKLDYSQQKALYARTYKEVSPAVRTAMEKALKNQNGK